MIQNNKINFTRNLREAARFRLKLRNSTIETDEKRDVESLFLSSRSFFNRLSFYTAKTNKIARAEDISFLLKNYSFFFHYINSNLRKIDYRIKSFKKDSEIYLSKINKEITLFKEQLEEIDIELNTAITECKVYKYFTNKDLKFGYDLIDLKTRRSIKPSDSVNTELDVLKIKDIYRAKAHVEDVCILKESSFLGEAEEPILVSKEPLNIIRENKDFKYIVGKKENLTNGMLNKHKVPELTILFNLGIEKTINEISIVFKSELPASLKDSKIEFFNKKDGWTEVNEIKSLKKAGFKDLQLFFNEITAKKIKLTFVQKKYFDTTKIDLNENRLKRLINQSNINFFEKEKLLENVKVYDLSVGEVNFYYSKQSNYGFYKEAEPISVKGIMSFDIQEDMLIEKEKCFLEKAAEVVLFGNNTVESFNTKEQDSLRIKTVVPLSNGKLMEEELLVFSNKESLCLLYPNIRKTGPGANIQNRIFVKEDGALLTMFEDYVVSLDSGETYIEDDSLSLGQLERNYVNKIAGLFKIKLLKEESFKKAYTVEYYLDPDFSLEPLSKILMKEGLISFSEDVLESSGYITPRFTLRSKSLVCESSIIKGYKVLIEESKVEQVDLNYAEFLETEGNGTNNVI